MALIPRNAVWLPWRERVEVVGYVGNGAFDIVDHRDIRFTVQREALVFLPGPKFSVSEPETVVQENQLMLF